MKQQTPYGLADTVDRIHRDMPADPLRENGTLTAEEKGGGMKGGREGEQTMFVSEWR